MTKKHTAFARVQLTVEIEASSWGEDCTVEQICKQAREAAKDAVMRGLVVNGLTMGTDNRGKVPGRIIGDGKVSVIMLEEE